MVIQEEVLLALLSVGTGVTRPVGVHERDLGIKDDDLEAKHASVSHAAQAN